MSLRGATPLPWRCQGRSWVLQRVLARLRRSALGSAGSGLFTQSPLTLCHIFQGRETCGGSARGGDAE